MTELKNVYVIDSLANIGKYAALGERFAKAVDLIAKGDFAALKSGRNDIAGDDVYVNCFETDYVAKADRKPEVHHAYFDIQIPLDADELFGLAELDPAAAGSFDESKDCGFYEQPVEWFTVKRGEFAICWPKVCAHAPAVTPDVPKRARKLVFKVRA